VFKKTLTSFYLKPTSYINPDQ